MEAKFIFYILLLAGVSLEVIGDIFFKKWSIGSKTPILILGGILYLMGTAFWAFSLKYQTLSKAGITFMLLNVILIALAGVFVFKDNLTTSNKIGIFLGIASIILIQL